MQNYTYRILYAFSFIWTALLFMYYLLSIFLRICQMFDGINYFIYGIYYDMMPSTNGHRAPGTKYQSTIKNSSQSIHGCTPILWQWISLYSIQVYSPLVHKTKDALILALGLNDPPNMQQNNNANWIHNLPINISCSNFFESNYYYYWENIKSMQFGWIIHSSLHWWWYVQCSMFQ